MNVVSQRHHHDTSIIVDTPKIEDSQNTKMTRLENQLHKSIRKQHVQRRIFKWTTSMYEILIF